MANNRTVGGL